jgi:hypothetical protein
VSRNTTVAVAGAAAANRVPATIAYTLCLPMKASLECEDGFEQGVDLPIAGKMYARRQKSSLDPMG